METYYLGFSPNMRRLIDWIETRQATLKEQCPMIQDIQTLHYFYQMHGDPDNFWVLDMVPRLRDMEIHKNEFSTYEETDLVESRYREVDGGVRTILDVRLGRTYFNTIKRFGVKKTNDEETRQEEKTGD